MLVYAMINDSRDKSIYGYEDGDPTYLGYATQTEDRKNLTEEDLLDLSEYYFQVLNRNDRPNGAYAPSLSVGDVLTFVSLRKDGSERDIRMSYAVEAVGFKVVDAICPTNKELVDHLNSTTDLAYGYGGE